jgi:hypothetical protein
MGAFLSIIARVLPMLFGVGETGGFGAMARGLVGHDGGVAGALKEAAAKVLPKELHAILGDAPKASATRKAPNPAEIVDNVYQKAVQLRRGEPVQPDPGYDKSHGMARIRFAESVAEAQGKGGYRVADPVAQTPPSNTPVAQTPLPTVGKPGGVLPDMREQIRTGGFYTPDKIPNTQAAATGLKGFTAKLGTAVQLGGKLAAGYISLIAGTLGTVFVFKKLAEVAVESNRGLSMWNGAIAASFSRLDFQRQQLDMQQASATSGSTTLLNETFVDLLEETQTIRQSIGTAVNLLMMGTAGAAKILTQLLKMDPGIRGITAILQKIEELLAEDPNDQNDPLEQFHSQALGAGMPAMPFGPNALGRRQQIQPMRPGGN